MARKTLLTEGELRRFMRLANMRPIGEEKIEEMYGGSMPGARDDEEDAAGDDMEMDMDMEMGPEDAGEEDDKEPFVFS